MKLIETKKIKSKLFKKKKNNSNRLYWKENISLRTIKYLLKDNPVCHEQIKMLFISSFKEKEKFLDFLNYKIKRVTEKTGIIYESLKQAHKSASIFNIQLIQEYLCLDKKLLKRINKIDYRINIPGIIDTKNWRLKLPVSLENLLKLKINKVICELNLPTCH